MCTYFPKVLASCFLESQATQESSSFRETAADGASAADGAAAVAVVSEDALRLISFSQNFKNSHPFHDILRSNAKKFSRKSHVCAHLDENACFGDKFDSRMLVSFLGFQNGISSCSSKEGNSNEEGIHASNKGGFTQFDEKEVKFLEGIARIATASE